MKNWQFWFTIIGAIITGFLMFSDFKVDVLTEFAVYRVKIDTIENDVKELKAMVAPHFVLNPKNEDEKDL